jgi:soluble lytic murein transglycosylase-like protein
VLGLQRLCQVITIAALAASGLDAQATPGCLPRSAEALLDGAPAAGASGFAMTQRLCLAKLVRSRTALTPSPEAVAAPAEAPAAAPIAVAIAPPPAPVAARPTTGKDAPGQARVRALAPLMADVASRHDIDPLLLHALAHIESRHQSQAISHAGARGLMQVMPATGRDLGVADARDLLTPQANLEASAKYLKRLQARFGNDLRLVLAAYNAGEGAVERHGRRVPPYAETQAYVRDVLAVYAELRRKLVGVQV